MKSRQTYIPRIRRMKGKTDSITNPRAANQNVHQTGQFTAAILGKYGFWRHDYLGLLSLIFKGHPGWKQLARNSAPSGHKAWLIKLQLQLQSLKHPDSYHLSTKKEIIHRLEQQITQLGHNRHMVTARKHLSSTVHPGQQEFKRISHVAAQNANREREAAELRKRIDNARIDNDKLESTERVHTQNNPTKQNPLDDGPSHHLDLPAEQNGVVGNRKDQALQQAAGILRWKSDAESSPTFSSIKWANRPGIEISLWGLQGIESKQGVGRIGWALPNMDHPEADIVSIAKRTTRRPLSKVQKRVIRDTEEIFHRHQVLHQELKSPASLAYTKSEPSVNERGINEQGTAKQIINNQSINNQSINSQSLNNQSDSQQNVGKIDSNLASSMKIQSQNQVSIGRMEHVESKPDSSKQHPIKGNAKQSARSEKRDRNAQNKALESQTVNPILQDHKQKDDQTGPKLFLNKQPSDVPHLAINVPRGRNLLQQSGRLIPFSLTHIEKNEGSPILQRAAAHFADSIGLAARRNSGHQQRLRVVQFYHSRNSSPSQRMHNSMLAIEAFESGSRKFVADRAEESAGALLASSSFHKLTETKTGDSVSQPRIQRRSILHSQDRLVLHDQAIRNQTFKGFSEHSEPSRIPFSLQAETTALHKAISRRNAPVSLNSKHITEYVESAMDLKQPSLRRRNESSPTTKRSQREFSTALHMQRSRQGVAAGSKAAELLSKGIMAATRQHGAARQIQFNSTDPLLQARATRQNVQSSTADQQTRSSIVGQNIQPSATDQSWSSTVGQITQQNASARRFRSRLSSQQIQPRMASEEAGYANVHPTLYIPGQISHKLGLSPFTFGAAPPAQRIFRKLSEEQMFITEPGNKYLRKQQKRKDANRRMSDGQETSLVSNMASGTVIRFGRPDDQLISRIKAKENAAPSSTQLKSQIPNQVHTVKYNELASMSFYQAKRRNQPEVRVSHPISTITTNYPNYESSKLFATRFQKPSGRMGSRSPENWQAEQLLQTAQMIRASELRKGSQTDRVASMDRGLGHKQATERSADHHASLHPKQISSNEPKAVSRAIISGTTAQLNISKDFFLRTRMVRRKMSASTTMNQVFESNIVQTARKKLHVGNETAIQKQEKLPNRTILNEQADLSVIKGSKLRMSFPQQTNGALPSAKSAERQTNIASISTIQKRNKPLVGATGQRSISQTALIRPKLISSMGIQRKTESIGIPSVGAITNSRSQSETDELSQAPVHMLLNYVQDNQTILEHKPSAEASVSELSNQPLEMDWLRLNQAEEVTPADMRPVEQPAPQLDMDQLKDLVKKLPQFDIKKIADRVYREIEKKIQFDRQRRGI